MALVRGVMAAATCSRSIARVIKSQSTKTGCAPTLTIIFMVEKKLCVEVMTSSPGPTPQASSASSMAPVAEVRLRVGRPPKVCDSACSNSCTRGPLAIQPLRMVSAMADIASSEMLGWEKLRAGTDSPLLIVTTPFTFCTCPWQLYDEWLLAPEADGPAYDGNYSSLCRTTFEVYCQ